MSSVHPVFGLMMLWRHYCIGTGILPPVQKAALSLLPTLVPPQNLPQLWPKLLEALLRLVRPQVLLLPSRPPSAGGFVCSMT